MSEEDYLRAVIDSDLQLELLGGISKVELESVDNDLFVEVDFHGAFVICVEVLVTGHFILGDEVGPLLDRRWSCRGLLLLVAGV